MVCYRFYAARNSKLNQETFTKITVDKIKGGILFFIRKNIQKAFLFKENTYNVYIIN